MTTDQARGTFTELQIEIAAEAAELLASVVSELTGGVEVRDAGTLLRAPRRARAAWSRSARPSEADAVLAAVEEACARARAAGLPVDPVSVRRREAHEDEWRDVWKQYFRATRVGRTFIVRPSWDPGTIADGDRVIDLDPGRAFGTGGHATTRLVIALAEEVEGRPVARFLDLGCGSGILAIAAARLWPAARGLAVDVDPEATACARREPRAQPRHHRRDARRARWPTRPAPSTSCSPTSRPTCCCRSRRALVGGAGAGRDGRAVGAAHRRTRRRVLAAYLAAGLALEARRDEDEWTALRLPRLAAARHEPPAPLRRRAERLRGARARARRATITARRPRAAGARRATALTLFDGAGTEVEARGRRASAKRDVELALGARRAVAAARRRPSPITLLRGRAARRAHGPAGPEDDRAGRRAHRARRSASARSRGPRRGARARWEKIAREAARQCGRADVPRVDEPARARRRRWRRPDLPPGRARAVGGRARAVAARRAASATPAPAGPATAARRARRRLRRRRGRARRAAGFAAVGLGPRILRVETAAIVAVALVQAAAGGLD